MNTSEVVSGVKVETESYLQEVERLSMDQIVSQPSPDEWSIGQMMIHLMNSGRFMQLRNVEACRDATHPDVHVGGCKTEKGEVVFNSGSFPAIRIQVPPSPQYTPAQPKTKEEIRDGMEDLIKRMERIAPTLTEIPLDHKIEHPGFGYLNATEWFQLIEMHYRHHQHQLARLKHALGHA